VFDPPIRLTVIVVELDIFYNFGEFFGGLKHLFFNFFLASEYFGMKSFMEWLYWMHVKVGSKFIWEKNLLSEIDRTYYLPPNNDQIWN